MRHANISIFIPHKGCPNLCSFCNQKTISGEILEVTPERVEDILSESCPKIKFPERTEIAFFGGSFTALPRDYMINLLEVGRKYVVEYGLVGIRISTRPDYISPEILSILKEYKVTAIELGAQSMSDEVLFENDRGHDSNAVRNASEMIKSYGFELGLQMMIGLYKSKIADEIYTANEIAKLSPKTVRIYPVVILKGTKLAELYLEERYNLADFDEIVSLTAKIMENFEKAGIDVIRVGLHSEENLKSEAVGGYFHPAFRELCEGKIYLKKFEEMELKSGYEYKIHVPKKDVSKAVGQKKTNLDYFLKNGIKIKIVSDEMVQNIDEIFVE